MKIRKLFPSLLLAAALLCSGLRIPVFAASETAPAMEDEKPVVILDPGHGGADGGTTAGVRYEKTYNLLIAQYLRDLLVEHGGFEVYLTREDDDADLKFLPRALCIVEHDADLLLSLHCNSSDVSYASGVLAITSVVEKYSASVLGEAILAGISEKTGLRNRGVETRYDTGDSLGVYYWNSEKQWDMPGATYLKNVSDYFSMNTWSSKFGVPSLIIEHGYLSNSGDRAIVDLDENLRKFAEAEAEALIEYYYGHTHTFSEEKVVDFPSSCSMTGTKSYRCSVCGLKAETESLPAAPEAHFYRQSASRRATCEEDGYIEYVCQISYNLNDKGYDVPVHSYTETLPKKGHAYRVVEDTPAGHGVDGVHVEYCDNCGDSVKTVTPGEPHSWETVEEIAPSCVEAGATRYQCAVCGESRSEEIPAVGHTPDENGVCATCGYDPNAPTSDDPSTDISSESSASESSASESSASESSASESSSCAHVYRESSRVEPTCEEDGATTKVCALCGDEKTVVLAALGHDYLTAIDTPASCESDSFYRARCLRCQKEKIETRPATGHQYVVKSESSDEIVKICAVCGREQTEAKVQRRLSDFIRNPVVLGICVILAAQIGLLFGMRARRRKKMNKFAQNNDNDTHEEDL